MTDAANLDADTLSVDAVAETASKPSDTGPARAVNSANTSAGPRIDAAAVTALAVKLAQKSAAGDTRFTVRLDPPELGRVDVRLDVGADGQTQARLIVERPEALSELARHARALERAMAEAGAPLGEGGLSLELQAGAHDAQTDDDAGPGDDDTGGQTAPDATPRAPLDAGAEVITPHGYAVLAPAHINILA